LGEFSTNGVCAFDPGAIADWTVAWSVEWRQIAEAVGAASVVAIADWNATTARRFWNRSDFWRFVQHCSMKPQILLLAPDGENDTAACNPNTGMCGHLATMPFVPQVQNSSEITNLGVVRQSYSYARSSLRF
jgi:hypothetical protein